MKARTTLLALVALALPGACLPGAAQARWTPAQLLSASLTEQAQTGTVPAELDLSADGRYAVFRTSSRNLFSDPEPEGGYRQGGIFRKDLLSGALELVVPGNIFSGDAPVVQIGAQNPSISADGRYVAFATGQQLVAADGNDGNDVYVRDMAAAPREAGAYALVSAPDGADGPASGAAIVSPRAAISDDGRRVAFHTTDPSDLPAAGSAAGQVLLRDLDARTTTLVNAALDGSPLGDTGPGSGGPGSVVLSADGTTVAWSDDRVAQQAPVVGGELETQAVEYLWRRVADGAGAVTRRVTGSGDPDDPACPAGGAISDVSGPVASPCDGPFQGSAGAGRARQLALSGDGRTAALVTGLRLRSLAQEGESNDSVSDLFVVDMRPGLSRKQAVTEVTRASITGNRALGATIDGLGLSADGRTLAFGTGRIGFLLPRPALVSPAANVDRSQQVYVADLALGTMALVTRTYDGAESLAGIAPASPVPSADGSVVAFVSEADRLVLGDGNGAGDAFAVRRVEESSTPLPQVLPAPAPALAFTPRAVLRVRAATSRRGTLATRVVAPGAGRLALRVTLGGRTLARAGRTVRRAGEARVVVRVAARARRRARLARKRRSPMRLRVRVQYSGVAPLTRAVDVRRRSW